MADTPKKANIKLSLHAHTKVIKEKILRKMKQYQGNVFQKKILINNLNPNYELAT